MVLYYNVPSHRCPIKTPGQTQLKLYTPSIQVPPFRQGFDMHSSVSVKKNLETAYDVTLKLS